MIQSVMKMTCEILPRFQLSTSDSAVNEVCHLVGIINLAYS